MEEVLLLPPVPFGLMQMVWVFLSRELVLRFTAPDLNKTLERN